MITPKFKLACAIALDAIGAASMALMSIVIYKLVF